MHWFSERTPLLVSTLAKAVAGLAIIGVAISVALWLLGEGGVLAVAGGAAAVALVWELGWDRRRRRQRRADLARAQQAPGTQALRSEAGAPHWTDRLPQPLRAIAQTGPVTLAAIGVLLLSFLLIPLFGQLGDDGSPHVSVDLEEGVSAEIEPPFGEVYRMRVTIHRIVDGAGLEDDPAAPRPGHKYWAVKVEIENLGSSNIYAPRWRLRDTEGVEYRRISVEGVGQPLPPASELAPGAIVTGWVVFEIGNSVAVEWLQATQRDPSGFYSPVHLYFRAK